MRKSLIVVFCLLGTSIFVPKVLLGQYLSQGSNIILQMPSNALTAGIGSDNVSLHSHDLHMALSNPALINNDSKKMVAFSFNPLWAGISQYQALVGYKLGKVDHLYTALQFLNYGNFVGRDAQGNETGNFTANEFVLTTGHSTQIENFSLGLNVKVFGGQWESYNALGLGIDLGAIFRHPTKDFTIGLSARNVGFMINEWTSTNQSKMPFNPSLGLSYRVPHTPFRIHITAHHLQKYDITYLNPQVPLSFDQNGDPIFDQKSIVDNIARHFAFATEFLFSQNFQLRVGYNHLRRSELKLSNVTGLEGFSVGGMLKVKGFEFSYTYAFYHQASGNQFLTLATTTDRFASKSKGLEDL